MTFKIGDKVVVVKKMPTRDTCWVPDMDVFVGNGEVFEVLTVSSGKDSDVRLNSSTSTKAEGYSRHNWWFPQASLKLFQPTFNKGDKVKVTAKTESDLWVAVMDFHIATGRTYEVQDVMTGYGDECNSILLNTEEVEKREWNSQYPCNWWFPATALELVEAATPAVEKASKEVLINALKDLGLFAQVEDHLAA